MHRHPERWKPAGWYRPRGMGETERYYYPQEMAHFEKEGNFRYLKGYHCLKTQGMNYCLTLEADYLSEGVY